MNQNEIRFMAALNRSAYWRIWFRAEPWYVLYLIGMTSNLERRIREHAKGRVESTRYRKDIKLIYYEAFLNKVDAERRERYFKTSKCKRSLKLMLRKTMK